MFNGVGYFPAVERNAKNLTGLQVELLTFDPNGQE
jgi:hypothetical protein